MNVPVSDLSTLWPPAWLQSWHFTLVLGVLALALYFLARAKVTRARDDFANAFFYSPSQKAKQRQRRQRWEDRARILLVIVVVAGIATAVLYLRAGSGP